MDLVYVYRRSGDEREIRYSLRSVCKNLKFDTVHIIGDRPRFATASINSISFRGAHTKHENSFGKLREAVMSSEVSDPFVLMNDDFYILKPMRPKYLYMDTLKGWIQTFPHNSQYKQKAIKTLGILGDKAKIFETHSPIVYEKDRLKFLIDKYALPCGIMLRSLYCNTFKVKGEKSQDYKARTPEELTAFSKHDWFSTSNPMALTGRFLEIMRGHFPQACRFEKVY